MTDNTSLLTASQLLRHNSIDIKSASGVDGLDADQVREVVSSRQAVEAQSKLGYLAIADGNTRKFVLGVDVPGGSVCILDADAHAGAAGVADADAGAPGSPPISNRGVKIDKRPKVTFGIDYFTASFKGSTLSAVASWVMFLLGRSSGLETFQYRAWGRFLYRESYIGIGGVCIYFNNSDGGDHIAVQMPGEFCRAIDAHLWHSGLNNMPGEATVTRCDPRFDHNLFTPADVRDEWRAGRVKSSTRRTSLEWHENDRIQPDKGSNTCDLGSRSSERYARIYDRFDEEHKPITRFELELKGKRATAFAAALAAAPVDTWANVAMGFVMDFAEFQTDWWREFVGLAERAHVVVSKIAVKTIDKVRAWVEKQVSPSLFIYMRSSGGDLGALGDLIKDGGKRLSGSQKELLSMAGL